VKLPPKARGRELSQIILNLELFRSCKSIKMTEVQVKIEQLEENIKSLDEENKSVHGLVKELEAKISALQTEKNVQKPDTESKKGTEGPEKEEKEKAKANSPPDNKEEDKQPTGAVGGQYSDAQASSRIGQNSADIQQEFMVIKDALQRIKLPNDLKVNDGARGIRRIDQPRATVVSKCARYAETLMKLLSTLDPENISDGDLSDMTAIVVAQVRYLQEEHSMMLVNSNFGEQVEKVYRTLRGNTSAFPPDALGALQASVEMANSANYRGNTDYNRGRGRSRFQRGGYRGRGYGRGGFTQPTSYGNQGYGNNFGAGRDSRDHGSATNTDN